MATKTKKEKPVKQGSLGDHQEFTDREWYALGWIMFGTADQAKWRWICPACRGTQTIQDFLGTEQEAHSAYQQCVKRKVALVRDVQELPKGMCDWAAYGFFSGPWFVTTTEKTAPQPSLNPTENQTVEVCEKRTPVLAFSGATAEQIARARVEVEALIPLIKEDQARLDAEDEAKAAKAHTPESATTKEESAAGFVVGDKVGYKSVIADEEFQHVGKVRSVHQDGIPSCNEPMLMIDGKGGVVLASHCTLLERA